MEEVVEGATPHPRAMADAIAAAGALDASIRRRTEGVTWVIWGLAYGGYGLTAALAAALSGAGLGIWWGLAVNAWEVVAIVASVGIWRSVALRIRPDVSARRGMLFFVAWWVLFGLAQRLAAAFVPGASGAVTALLAFAALLAVFALWNPLRFSALGRRTAAFLSAVAAAGAILGLVAGLPDPLALAYVGGVLGVSWTAGGLIALYRG